MSTGFSCEVEGPMEVEIEMIGSSSSSFSDSEEVGKIGAFHTHRSVPFTVQVHTGLTYLEFREDFISSTNNIRHFLFHLRVCVCRLHQ